jgi:hypothetical protein
MLNRTLLAENKDDFLYLFELQRQGRCNMFGAGQYLQDEQGLDRAKAREVLAAWMQGYEEIAKELGVDI